MKVLLKKSTKPSLFISLLVYDVILTGERYEPALKNLIPEE